MADVFQLHRMSYVVVFGAAALNLATGMLEPIIAPYLVVLGASNQEVGFILSSRFFVVALASIPLALFAEQFGLKRFLHLAGLTAMLAGISLVTLSGKNAVLAFYLLIGLSQASLNGPGSAILAKNPGTKRIAAFGLFSATWMIPPALGALFSAAWYQDLEGYVASELATIFWPAFLSLTILSMLFMILTWWSAEEEENHHHSSDCENSSPIMRSRLNVSAQFKLLFASSTSLPFILLILEEFISGAGAGGTLPFLTPYLKEIGATPTMLSLLFFLQSMLMGIAAQLAAPLGRLIGELKVFFITGVAAALTLIGFVLTNDLQVAAALFILRAALANMSAPIALARIMNFIDPRVRATGGATTSTARWLGWSLYSPVSGKIIDEFGYVSSFAITSVMYIFTAAFFVWINKTFRPVHQ